jgi:hypothetical protein
MSDKMRTMTKWAILAIALMGSAVLLQAQGVQSITAAQAASHVGESETVCGRVASEHFAAHSRGRPTFLNLDAPYPRQVFTIVVWGDDRGAVGAAMPAQGQRTCVTGVVILWTNNPSAKHPIGVPQIIARKATQFRLTR